MKYIVNSIDEELKKDPKYFEKEAIEAEKLVSEMMIEKFIKQQKHENKNNIHVTKMAIVRKQKEIEEKERDKKRKETKQLVKEKTSRKGSSTIYREYSAEEIAAMTVSKRRNLQDKGIIAKKI